MDEAKAVFAFGGLTALTGLGALGYLAGQRALTPVLWLAITLMVAPLLVPVVALLVRLFRRLAR